MLKIADHGLFQPQMVQQLQGDAGVLRGHKIGQAEGGRHPGRHIVQVADGGGHHIQGAGHKRQAPFQNRGGPGVAFLRIAPAGANTPYYTPFPCRPQHGIFRWKAPQSAAEHAAKHKKHPWAGESPRVRKLRS